MLCVLYFTLVNLKLLWFITALFLGRPHSKWQETTDENDSGTFTEMLSNVHCFIRNQINYKGNLKNRGSCYNVSYTVLIQQIDLCYGL